MEASMSPFESKTDDYEIGVKREKTENADNDVSANIATGVGAEEENEKSLNELVFSNPLLLGEIFKYSTFQDLKSHRQLNTLWNLEATKAILNRSSIKPIQLLPRGAKLNSKIKSFLSLNQFQFQLLVEQSKKFPCGSYLIDEAPLENLPLKFLQTHGNIIKILVYGSTASVTLNAKRLSAGFVVQKASLTCEEFIQLLADNLPNLEVLILKSCLSSSQTNNSSSHGHGERTNELKKLRDLKISCDLPKEFLSLMLKRSPNLKNIYLTHPSGLQTLVELNVIYLLNKLCFEFNADSISLYKQVVTTQQLKCKELNMKWSRELLPKMSEDDLPKVGRILSEALHKCSGTLQILSLDLPLGLGQVPQMRFATCPKVTRLKINYSNPADLPFAFAYDGVYDIQGPPFPTDFNLGVIFPNLKEFKLSFDYFWQILYFYLFPKTSIPLLCVRILNFIGPYGTNLSIPTKWLKQFCHLFPNITTASFGNVLDSDFGLISNFRFLEKLEFMICVEETDEDFVRVDSLFTGFSRETVQEIYRQLGTGFSVNVEDVEDLRVAGSVADLKNLTELVIGIIPRDWHDEWKKCYLRKDDFVVGSGLDVKNPVLKMRRNVIISHVSRKFSFDMCPKLGSNIVVKMHPDWDACSMPRT